MTENQPEDDAEVLADARAEFNLQPASEWVVRLAACGLAAISEVGGSNTLSGNPGRVTTSGDGATGGEGREEVRAPHRFDELELDPRWTHCLPSGPFKASVLFLSACRTDGTEASDPLENSSDSRINAFVLADEEIDGDGRYEG